MLYIAKVHHFIFILIFSILPASTSCSKNSSSGGSVTPPPTPAPVYNPDALRGAWVTTAASTALDSKDNIKQCVAACKANNINSIFMVVYNNGRTFLS